MSGVNWIPRWALGGSDGDRRFRVFSDGEVASAGLRNWYTDPAVGDAQVLLAARAATALAGHEALWAWDLGNENSNCVIPPNRASARAWLERLTGAIRDADETAVVTVGLHMEDLEEDRHLGPFEASAVSDLLSMHGYPLYASWADGPTDDHLLPFLARVTHWLGEGRGVLFSEFGLPTYRRDDRSQQRDTGGVSIPLIEEEAAAAFTTMALEGLRRSGCLGAMLWCFSDYQPALWGSPPLDLAVHERTFGLWRVDGSPKPAVAAIAAFVGAERCIAESAGSWIDIDRDEFRRNPSVQLPRLYRRYRRDRRAESR
jgi:endo-1,4-beta-mannosidase